MNTTPARNMMLISCCIAYIGINVGPLGILCTFLLGPPAMPSQTGDLGTLEPINYLQKKKFPPGSEDPRGITSLGLQDPIHLYMMCDHWIGHL